MRLFLTKSFEQDYSRLPEGIQVKLDATLALFIRNPRHPSLQVKKIKGVHSIWEGRITLHYRFTFMMDGDLCIVRRAGTHDILRTP